MRRCKKFSLCPPISCTLLRGDIHLFCVIIFYSLQQEYISQVSISIPNFKCDFPKLFDPKCWIGCIYFPTVPRVFGSWERQGTSKVGGMNVQVSYITRIWYSTTLLQGGFWMCQFPTSIVCYGPFHRGIFSEKQIPEAFGKRDSVEIDNMLLNTSWRFQRY